LNPLGIESGFEIIIINDIANELSTNVNN